MKTRRDKADRPPYLRISDSKNLRKYWDYIGEHGVNCNQTRPTITNIYDRKRYINLFRRWLNLSPAQNILKYDLFNEAGWNQVAFYFMRKRVATYFIEISRVIAEKAAGNIKSSGLYDYAYIVIGDFRKLPFKDNAFDDTCSLDSITYTPEWEESMREQVRATKPGGRVIITVPNTHNICLGSFFLRFFDGIGFLQRESYASFSLTRKTLKTAGRNSGLVFSRVYGFCLMIPQLSWFDRLSERSRRSGFTAHMLQVKDFLIKFLEESTNRIEQRQTRLNLLGENLVLIGQKKVNCKCTVSTH